MSNSGRTALWKAAQAGHRQVVLRLVAAGAAINTQNQVGIDLYRNTHSDLYEGSSEHFYLQARVLASAATFAMFYPVKRVKI